MYIRRKVFSLLQDEMGEERYFSTTDITLEDAEQRIFSKKEDNLSESRSPKAAVAVGGSTAIGGTALALINKKDAKKGARGLEGAMKKIAQAKNTIGANEEFIKEATKSKPKTIINRIFNTKTNKAINEKAAEITKNEKIVGASNKAIKNITAKYGRSMSLHSKGKKAALAGAGLAALGTAVELTKPKKGKEK